MKIQNISYYEKNKIVFFQVLTHTGYYSALFQINNKYNITNCPFLFDLTTGKTIGILPKMVYQTQYFVQLNLIS